MVEKILAMVGIVLFLVLVLWGLGKLFTLADAKRRAAWKREAAKFGFPFVAADAAFPTRYGIGAILKTDTKPTFHAIVTRAQQGSTVVVVEHSATGKGPSNRAHHYNETMCVVQIPGMNLPVFNAKRKDWLADAVTSHAQGKIAFPDDPQFSEEIHVRGVEEGRIRQTFHPTARRAFLVVLDPKARVAGCGQTLLMQCRKTIAPARMQETMNQAFHLATTLAATS